MRIAALLEQRHGIGFWRGDLPCWLTLLVARSEITRVRSFCAAAVEGAPDITAFRPH